MPEEDPFDLYWRVCRARADIAAQQRRGEFVTLSAVLEAVGINACRCEHRDWRHANADGCDSCECSRRLTDHGEWR